MSVITRISLPRDPRETSDHPADFDPRFAKLVGSRWVKLPSPIRKRFSRHMVGGDSIVYSGSLTHASSNFAGRCLAQFLRLIGAPLPLSTETGMPSIVSVTEDAAGGGQIWSRLHCNRQGFPQTISSAKRFSGPTGLEEYLTSWLSIALIVSTEQTSLVFHSHHVAFHLGKTRLRLPEFLSPGVLTIKHTEIGGGWFRFSLDLTHRRLGCLMKQVGVYQEDRR
ncbi:MAG: DUF4166 domain-containing protein [Pseudomonadota bacterium]